MEQAIDAYEGALETTPDEIVAIMPRPWAVDAANQPVATSLSASGSTVTMALTHGSGTSAYPVVASSELIVGDALDEWVAMESDAETADYTEADFVAQPGLAQGAPTAPEDIIPDNEFEFDPESIDDPSAFENLDLESPDRDAGEVGIGEADAAANAAARPLNAQFSLTESHPAVLHSPDRRGMGAASVRPVVPWRVTQMLRRPQGNATRRRAEQKRAFLWDSQRGGTPSGYFNVAESPTAAAGVKSPAEVANGVTTDVALQFAQAQGRHTSTGQRFEFIDSRAPRVFTYRRLLREFLQAYRSVLLDANGRPTGNLTPWNEPQLRKNPTRQLPIRAARYWAVANALCHPRGGPHLCAEVVAGEYSGTRSDQRIERGFRTRTDSGIRVTRSYQRTYHDYLFGRLVLDYPRNTSGERRQRPRVWGYHTYDDANRHQRRLRGGARWPITDRYYRRFTGPSYRLRDGSFPRVWVTATGVFYHRDCGPEGSVFRGTFCTGGRNQVLFGMRSQRNTLTAMLRKLSKLPRIGRLY